MNRVALAFFAALAVAAPTLGYDQPISAFASDVGKRVQADEPAPPITIYVVPDGRTLLLTDVLVANRGLETGILYLGDAHHRLCSVSLMQTTFMNNPAVLSAVQNPHVSFTTGIPIGPGEPVIVTLDGGNQGVDVTITGKLVPGPRVRKAVVVPGGKSEPDEGAAADGAPSP